MVVFGLILVLVGVGGGGFLAWLALNSEGGITLGMTGLQVTVLPITLFASGAVSMLLLWLGVRAIAAGARRRSSRRKEMRQLRKDAGGRPEAADSSF